MRPNTNLILLYLGGTEHYPPAVSISGRYGTLPSSSSISWSSREQTATVRHCSKWGNPSGCNVLARDRESGHSPRYHPHTARVAMTLWSNFAGNVLPIQHEAYTFRRLKNHFTGKHSQRHEEVKADANTESVFSLQQSNSYYTAGPNYSVAAQSKWRNRGSDCYGLFCWTRVS